MYLIQTVQTSWRPQLPLPKEIPISDEHIDRFQYDDYQREIDIVDVNQRIVDHNMMDRFYHKDKKDATTSALSSSQMSHASSGGNKKWSFGRLFRRKKEIESESSTEDDRKAGFSPSQKHSRVNAATITNKTKKQKTSNRGSGKVSNGPELDRVVVNQSFLNHKRHYGHHAETEFFLPVEIMPVPKEHYYQNQQAQPQQPTQLKPQQQQYLPHATIINQDQHNHSHMSRSANSLERRSARSIQKNRSDYKSPPITNSQGNAIVCSSSEEELTSLNSATFSKHRSDESAYSGSQAGCNNNQNRKSRAARNERYYKRLSRDSENSNGQIPINYTSPPTSVHKWKTQPVPLSIYQASKESHASLKALKPNFQNINSNHGFQHSKLRNTSSLQHVAPYVQWSHVQQRPKNLQNSVNDAKRSVSYDSHIHLQKINNKQQTKLLPPPPPPRDPTRRVNITGHLQNASYGDLRPISYAFDQVGIPVMPANGLNGRCVSDDKIWAQTSHYQSINSLNMPQVQQSVQNQRNCRFTSKGKHGEQFEKTSSPNGLEFHYVADAAPRSRKPIHLLNQSNLPDETNDPPSSGILRTTKSGLPSSPPTLNASEFWKHLDKAVVQSQSPASRGRHSERATVLNGSMKPRSVSSSRVTELRSYPIPMYSEVYKPKRKPQASATSTATLQTSTDEVDSVICGSLFIKPSLDNEKTRVEIRNKDVNKSNSMPNHYQRRSSADLSLTTSNIYDAPVIEKNEQQHSAPVMLDAPLPSKRTVVGLHGIPQISFPRKKPTNLEEAINELEAIYKSLGLTDENEKKEGNASTTADFEKFALAHADEYEEEDSPTGEPDPIRDDVAYRNIKLANLQHKTVEKQPPFGIPLGPIVPASKTDYLHIESGGDIVCVKHSKTPDVVKDDLAVRTLRKEPPGSKERFIYPTESLIKKNRATRTQSANIYSLIQRDAAKPAGGDIMSLYYEWTPNVDRSGSMSDIHKNNSPNDIPSTLKLLQSLREQEQEVQLVKKVTVPFRHPSQGGAICQLPEVLRNPLAKDEKSSKPTPLPRKSITPEPLSSTTSQMEEALNKIAQDAQESSIKLTQELKELRKEALITASKPKNTKADEKNLDLELREIEKVSEAAKQCSKMLLDAWPVGKEEQSHKNLHKEDKLIKAIDQVSEAANKVCEKILNDMVVNETTKINDKTLMKSLESMQTSTIDDIAKRCMRQLKDLAEPTDYDNVRLGERNMVSTCNVETIEQNRQPLKELSNSNLTEYRGSHRVVTKPNSVIEEIDQIMKECEDQARDQGQTNSKDQANDEDKANKVKKSEACSATTSSFSSSSDCLVKSSSPSASRRQSSSITSFNPYSSSDYIKSPSSDFQAPSTDPIKTFSTTSYDVQTTTNSATSIVTTTTNSNVSYSPSSTPPPPPPPQSQSQPQPEESQPVQSTSNNMSIISVRPQNGHSSSPSQYNSSEELAQIFGHVDENTPRNQESVSTSNKNDFEIIESATIYLNSASATAKKSCQQQKQLQPDLQSQFEQQLEQQQQKQHQQEQQQQQINQKNTTGTKRYQGHHPHFHHHTTPAYYTDLHLRIHTPEAKDSLNENYQSVYRTPTNLVKDERQFPKSSTATVAPPPISGKNSTKSDSINNNNNNIPTEKLNKAATSAFFRGGTAIKEPQKISEIYARSSPTSATNPVKGNLDIDSPRTARVVASSIVPFNSVTSTAEHKTQSLNKPISGSTSAERSRNCKRFSNRKKVVRVRSESRPISALYEIICKETGHDLITTSTNDEDSSSVSNISDDENIRNHHARRSRRSHSSSLSRQNKLHGTGNSSTMSGGLENSSGGDFPQQKPNAQLKKSNPIYINDLSEDDDDLVHVEGGCSRKNLRLRVTQKTTNLLDEKRQPRKVASLPHNQISQDTHHHIPQQFHIYIPSVETSSSSNAPLRNIHSLKQVDSKSSEHKKELPNISSSNKSSSNNNIGCTIPLVGGTDLQGNEECSAQDEMKTGATDKALTLFPTASTPYESLTSPKGARFTRKYKRNRDEKQRRHTVSSIKLTNDASENDDQQQQKQEQQQQQQQQQQKKQQQYNQDLNGAGHENHALPPTNASKRYITRNQQRNNSSGLNGNVSPHSVHAVIPSDSLPPPELGTATVTAETSAIIKNKRAIATGGKPTTKSTKPTTKATTTTTTINSDKHYIDMTNSAKVSATSAKNASPTELKSSSAIGGAGSCGGGGGGGVEADSNGTLSNATATTTSSTTSIPNRNMQIPDKKKDDPTSPKHHLMLNASVSLGVTQGISNSDSEQQQGNKLSSPTSAYNNCQQSVIGKKSIATASCYANRSRSINLKTNSACLLKTFKQKSQNSDTTIKTKEPKISKSSTLSSQMIRKDDIKFIKNIYGEPEEIEEEEHRYVEEDEEVDDDENENDNDNDDDDDDDDNDDNDDDDDDDNRDNVNDDCDDNDDDRDDGNDEEEYEEDDMLEINDLPAISMNFTKPLYSPNVVSPDINNTLERMETLDLRQSLDKVRKCNEERDKSSKRKSNLNRSLNEEAAFDNDESAALRRRRRRELGMARQLVPGDDEAIAVRDLISPQKYKCTLEDEKTKISPTTQVCYLDMTHKGIDSTNTTKNQTANDNGYGETYKGMYTLGYHMEMARKGQDKMNERRRGQISSPRKEKTPPRAISKPNRINDPALLDDLKMQRSSDVNRKVNERTRADLADIIKIAELANECTQSTCNAISILNETVNLLRVNQVTVDSEGERKPSPAKHATFLEEECIYYEPYPLENCDAGTDNDDENLQASPVGGGILRTQRMLKARSVEGDVGYEIPKLSPILRRKSTDDPAGGISTGTSQIVSILKKKDHLSAGDSSSASSNASPVTFSSNVVDTPTKQKRAGILKKRSSLDESRYYSRSHSPDERSILVKSARRNSLEETAAGSNSTTSGHHGILKQSSYDSNKSDGCPSASGESSQPHSILKKKDSTSTPCDGASGHSSKHVSISQAVILAAAELYAAETGISPSSNGHDSLGFTPNNEEYELRPILKPETPSTEESIRPPKPILKKKSLGDSDEHEIKPILKTSRKSSREESDLSNVHGEGEQSGEPLVKPILKTDSPSKRRSLGDADHTEEDRSPDSSLLKRRTRSLERQDAPIIDLGEALNAIATSQTQANELATTLTNSVAGQNFSVAERIKCMEKFLNFTSAGNQTRDSITSLDLPCVVASAPDTCFKQVTSKRELYKDRFKTQPVTNEEKNAFKSNASVSHTTTSTTSTKSLEGLCGSPSLPLFNTQINRQQPNVSSFFTLTRSPTQSVQTSVVIKSSSNFSTPSQSAFTSIAASAISASSTPSSPVNNLAHKTSINSAIKSINMSSVTDILELSPISGSDNNINTTNNTSESRIIEMSSLELDVDMPETKLTESQTNASSTCGIVRTNSVRARANMFQQLQKKPSAVTSNREERTSPKRVTSRPSPSSTIVIQNNNNDHANKTLQIANNSQRTLNTTDDEIEPSTLSLSARLRFFSSLSDTSIRSPGSYSRGSPPYSSIDSSSNGSSSTYLTTQRNTDSTGSFNSLTSTPMDYTSTMALESPSVSLQEIVRHRPLSLQLTPTAHEHNSLPSYDHADAASAVIKPDIVKTSPFLQGKISNKTDPVSSIIEQPITPTSTLTPTMKRIKLKIIGKLMLPRTFQSNDRNNNIDKESKLISDDNDTLTENGFDCSESEISIPPKKIGKIKSLFIENCNQLPQRQTLPSSNKYMKMDLKSPPYNMLGSLENSMTNGHFNALPDNNNSNGKLNGTDNKSEQHHSDESSNDSGKENIDVLVVNEHTKSVVETRRKFSRKPPNNNNNNNNSNNNQSLNHGNLTSPSRPLSQQLNSNSMIENGKTPTPNNQLSNKFAKYFGETMTAERQTSHGNFTSHSRSLNEQLSTNSAIENSKTSLPNNQLSNKFLKYFGVTMTTEGQTSHGSFTSHSRSLSEQLSSNSVIENGKTSLPNNQFSNKSLKYFGVTMTTEGQARTTLTKSKSFSSTNIKLVPDVCQMKPQTPRNDIIKESYDVRRTPSTQITSQRSLASLRKGHLWSNCTPMQQHSRRGIKRRAPVYQKITNYDQIMVTEEELKNADRDFDEICRAMDESEIQQLSEEFDILFKNIL